jgi:hypothetical protein
MRTIQTVIASLLPCLLFVLTACNSKQTDRLTSAKIEQYKGRTIYNINGKQYPPMVYAPSFSKARSPYGLDGQANYANFTHAGVDLFEMSFYIRNAWNEDGTLNTEIVDEELVNMLRGIYAINPQAFFQLRIHLNAPAWWHQKYPEDLVNYAKGPVDYSIQLCTNPLDGSEGNGDVSKAPRASLASERWQTEATDILKQTLDYLRTTDVGNRIFSLMLAHGVYGEWHYFGYKQEPDTGEAMTKRFRNWLTDKYKTDSALQLAWGDPKATIAAATVPDLVERQQNTGVFRDPRKERKIIDYFHCHQETVEGVIRHFTKFVKTTWPSEVLVGLFNGYHFSDNDFNANGHLYFDRLLDWPHIDFFAAPYNYNSDARILGGTGQPRSLIESVRLHGKLWMTEQDRISHLPKPRPNEPATENDEESIAVMRSAFAQLVSRATGYWWMDFCGHPSHPSINSIGGNWNSPKMMAEIKHQKDFCDEILHREYTSVADVAFIYDFNSYYYMAETDNRQTREIEYASNNWLTSDAYCSGAAFDTYLLSDLPLIDLDKYKVFVFGTTYCISDAQIDFINTNIKKNGRTVIFNYAPAYTDGEKLDINRMKSLTGMNVRQISLSDPPQMTVNGIHYGLTLSGEAGKAPVSPLFAIDESGVEILGAYKDTEIPAIAQKSYADHKIVYAALPLRNPDLMRRLFREAGAHIYNNDNDVVIAGGGVISIASKADKGGKRTIRLRNGKEVALDIKPASTVMIDDQTGAYIFE